MRVEEALQADDIGAFRRPDQDRPAGAGFDQRDAAQNERTHDLFAELSLGDQHVAQSIRRDQERRDVGESLGIDERRSAGQLPDLGEKIARPFLQDGSEMSEGIALRDRDLPVDDDRTCRERFRRS